MAKAKNEIVVVNTGLSAIYINRELVMPDDEFEIPSDYLELPAFESLFAVGSLTVKDDSAATKEVVERARAKAKKDPFEGKSRKELEDGGEF